MSIFNYLQLQTVDPQDDGTVSDLDEFAQDETIDLTQDEDGDQLVQEWTEIINDLHSVGSENDK